MDRLERTFAAVLVSFAVFLLIIAVFRIGPHPDEENTCTIHTTYPLNTDRYQVIVFEDGSPQIIRDGTPQIMQPEGK